jgi:hypothetical protein
MLSLYFRAFVLLHLLVPNLVHKGLFQVARETKSEIFCFIIYFLITVTPSQSPPPALFLPEDFQIEILSFSNRQIVNQNYRLHMNFSDNYVPNKLCDTGAKKLPSSFRFRFFRT